MGPIIAFVLLLWHYSIHSNLYTASAKRSILTSFEDNFSQHLYMYKEIRKILIFLISLYKCCDIPKDLSLCFWDATADIFFGKKRKKNRLKTVVKNSSLAYLYSTILFLFWQPSYNFLKFLLVPELISILAKLFTQKPQTNTHLDYFCSVYPVSLGTPLFTSKTHLDFFGYYWLSMAAMYIIMRLSLKIN